MMGKLTRRVMPNSMGGEGADMHLRHSIKGDHPRCWVTILTVLFFECAHTEPWVFSSSVTHTEF